MNKRTALVIIAVATFWTIIIPLIIAAFIFIDDDEDKEIKIKRKGK